MRRAPQYLPLFLLLLTYAIVFEYTVRTRDWFYWYPYVDNLMHFGWGAVIALAIIIFWRNSVKLVLVTVFIWQVLWEIGEMIVNVIKQDPPHMRDYPFPDGTIDTILDLLGAAVVLWLTRRSRKLAQNSEPREAASGGQISSRSQRSQSAVHRGGG